MSTEHNPLGTIRRESHSDGGYSVWIKMTLPLAGDGWLCVLSTAPGNVMQTLPASQDMGDCPVVGVIDLRLDFVVTGFNPPLVTQ